MKLTFLGAAGTVTGSKYMLEHEDTCILIDCGLFQGLKDLRKKNWEPLNIDINKIDAVVLTHAHIDHSGYLPRLTKSGFDGRVHCTKETKALMEILLPDAAMIQEEDARHANKKKYSKHKPALPLYTVKDVELALKNVTTHDFENKFNIGPFEIIYRHAGHILGAASTHITCHGKSILFSGDLGRSNDPLMYPPQKAINADTILMETTYGERNHPDENPVDTLKKIIAAAKKNKSVILIPSFAVARAQLILYYLKTLFDEAPELELPVFVNSPMTTNVSELYEKNPGAHKLDKNQIEELFDFPKFLHWAKESVKLNEKKGPMIIISASGMLTGGRILHHLQAFGKDPNNIVLLVGYQAEGTRGRDLEEGQREIKVHGSKLLVGAQIIKMDHFSAHADKGELIAWLGDVDKDCHIQLVHGEDSSLQSMQYSLKELGYKNVSIAIENQTIEL